jgi:hypothetical protein
MATKRSGDRGQAANQGRRNGGRRIRLTSSDLETREARRERLAEWRSREGLHGLLELVRLRAEGLLREMHKRRGMLGLSSAARGVVVALSRQIIHACRQSQVAVMELQGQSAAETKLIVAAIDVAPEIEDLARNLLHATEATDWRAHRKALASAVKRLREAMGLGAAAGGAPRTPPRDETAPNPAPLKDAGQPASARDSAAQALEVGRYLERNPNATQNEVGKNLTPRVSARTIRRDPMLRTAWQHHRDAIRERRRDLEKRLGGRGK